MASIVQRNVTTSTSNASTYATTSFTPVQGDLLVVLAAVSGTVTPTSPACTASANGITFTRIGSNVGVNSADLLFIFVANQLVGASPSSMTCTVDVTGDAGTGCAEFVLAAVGMEATGSAAVRQNASSANQAGPSSPTVTFSNPTRPNNPIVGLFGTEAANPAAVTPPAGWFEDSGADTGFNNPTFGAEYTYVNNGVATLSVVWGSSMSTYGAFAIELAAPPPPPVTLADRRLRGLNYRPAGFAPAGVWPPRRKSVTGGG